jgi:hypothetical protein
MVEKRRRFFIFNFFSEFKNITTGKTSSYLTSTNVPSELSKKKKTWMDKRARLRWKKGLVPW